LGDTYNNDNEELLVLPFGEFELDIAQYIKMIAFLSFKTGSSRCTRRKFKTEALRLKELILKNIKEKLTKIKTQDKEENIDRVGTN
jgi:hypothetical protein